MNLDSPAGRAVIEAAAEDAYMRRHHRPIATAFGDEADWWRQAMRDGFTAALAVRVPCVTCGGTGIEMLAGEFGKMRIPCPTCGGSGSVSALRVLLDEEGAS